MTDQTAEISTVSERYLVSALVESNAALTTLSDFIKNAGATVIKTEDLGPRRLAFPIEKKSELTLISVFFTTEPSIAHTLEEKLRHESSVKRFLLTKWAVDPTEEPTRKPRVKEVANEEGGTNV